MKCVYDVLRYYLFSYIHYMYTLYLCTHECIYACMMYTYIIPYNTHTTIYIYTIHIYIIGTHKPWYFIFDPRYYYTCYRDLRGLPRTSPTTTTTTATGNTASHTTVPVEPVATNLASQIDTNTCVQVKGLCKAFYNGFEKKVAVDHLDLTMYSSQITALLGHNGRYIWMSVVSYVCINYICLWHSCVYILASVLYIVCMRIYMLYIHDIYVYNVCTCV